MSTVNLRRSTRIRAQSKRFQVDYVDDINEQNVRVRRSRKSNINIGQDNIESAETSQINAFVRQLENPQPLIESLCEHNKTTVQKSDYNTDNGPKSNVLKDKCENEVQFIEQVPQKPSELFAEQDVNGKRLYAFSTPARKDGMTRKAMLCRTPTTLNIPSKVPKVLPTVKIVLEKINPDLITTYKVDKRRNTSAVNESTSKDKNRYKLHLSTSDSESISEGSDYMPSEGEDKDTDSENSDTHVYHTSTTKHVKDKVIDLSDNDEELKELWTNKSSHLKELNTSDRKTDRCKAPIVSKNFHMKTDDYFENQSQKVITSNNTLGKLQTSRLTEEKLQQLLARDNHIKDAHKKSIYNLSKNYRKSFKIWDFIMRQGYSVLLYGLGSKRSLINDFHKNMIFDYPTLVVNGFFPSLTIKDILDGILTDLLELESSSNVSDCVNLISETLNENPNDRLYLLIHNIDGIMLRTNKSQDTLSRLASIPNLYLIASIDHINAPLMWDHVKRSRYNFCWCDASTFLTYNEETSYENSLLVQQRGALALSSLHNVFRSLTVNARAIYKVLVKYQLNNYSNNNFPGMPFKELYRAAREGFLVSSDLALRAQLTEFIDHKLVRSKRHIDGAEYLTIPINNSLLKEFLEEHEN